MNNFYQSASATILKTLIHKLLLPVLLMLPVACLVAQPGAPETSFNGTGYVLATVPGNHDTQFEAGVAQRDGKIIAAGGTQMFPNSPYNSDFVVVRYNADGSPDASFGTGGIVTTDLGGTNDIIFAVALQQDGKIVAAGRALRVSDSYGDCAIARYNPDGSLDATFGNAGTLVIPFSGNDDEIHDVLVEPGGKLVFAGTRYSTSVDFLLFRLNPNGSFDAGFGDQGKVIAEMGGFDLGASITLQPDGKILMAGDAAGNVALARFNADGSADPSFGLNGKVITDINGSYDDAGRSVVWKDNKIIVGGWSIQQTAAGGKYFFALLGFNADGSTDLSFGNNGIVLTDFGVSHDNIYEIIARDGKIIAAGTSSQSPVELSNEDYDLALAQYMPNGTLDAGFGAGGKVHSDFSAGSGLISSDHAKSLFFYKNTLYLVGQAAHFTAEWDFTRYGIVAAYQLEPSSTCYINHISDITATPSKLWPPNNKMVEVALQYTVSADCEADLTVSVSHNEEGGNQQDWQIIDDHHVLLRAKRNGNGTGRIYTISVSGTDVTGNSITKNVEVIVPKSGGHANASVIDPKNKWNDLNATISPNPSYNHFSASITSGSTEPIIIRVFDVNGKLVEILSGKTSGQILSFGHTYRPGAYFIKIKQGSREKNIKVMKMR